MDESIVTKRQLRSFGLIVGSGFFLIAISPVALRGERPRICALVVALLLCVAALTVPLALRPLHRVWMTIGTGLGWLNTRILLTVLYYVIIVPIGVIMRVAGKDPLGRKFQRQAATYRTAHDKRPAIHMQRQY
jgi:hypothetical protein